MLKIGNGFGKATDFDFTAFRIAVSIADRIPIGINHVFDLFAHALLQQLHVGISEYERTAIVCAFLLFVFSQSVHVKGRDIMRLIDLIRQIEVKGKRKKYNGHKHDKPERDSAHRIAGRLFSAFYADFSQTDIFFYFHLRHLADGTDHVLPRDLSQTSAGEQACEQKEQQRRDHGKIKRYANGYRKFHLVIREHRSEHRFH